MTESNGWDNHENTFEETIRTQLLAAQEIIRLLQLDLKQMTEAYYSVLTGKSEKERLH